MDTYKDSFDDPSETLALSKIGMQLFRGHKWVLATMLVIFLVLLAAIFSLFSLLKSSHSAAHKTPVEQVPGDVISSDHKALDNLGN